MSPREKCIFDPFRHSRVALSISCCTSPTPLEKLCNLVPIEWNEKKLAPVSSSQSTLKSAPFPVPGLNGKPIKRKLEIPRGNPTPSRSPFLYGQMVFFVNVEWIVRQSVRSYHQKYSNQGCEIPGTLNGKGAFTQRS